MTRWMTCLLCSLAALPALGTLSWAQTPAGTRADATAAVPDQLTQLEKRVAELEAKMVTKDDLDAMEAKLLKAVQEAAAGQQTTSPRPMAPIPTADQDRVKRMEFEALKDMVLENRTILEQVTENVSNRSGGGLYVPNIRAAMDQSERFRKDMKEVVHKSMDQRGTIIIRNKTALGRSVRIRAADKNVTVYVPAGGTHSESVAVGTVSTELIGEEAPKNWMLGPPNNSQQIDILPAASPVVVPTTSYYYSYDPYTGLWY